MKSSKNILVATTLSIAVALGCANIIDSAETTATASQATQQEIAQADIDNTLFRGGVREEVIIFRPE